MDSFPGRSGRQPVHRDSAPQPVSAPPTEAQPVRHSTPVNHSRPTPTKKFGGKNKLLWGLIGIAIVGFIAWIGFTGYNTFVASRLIDSGKYQAVFLTNGQVYFGKLSRVNNETYTLNKIFYLQASQQAGVDAENPQETAAASSNVQLIKLGSEVHGPEDKMVIDRAQVLFFENLKKDGKVAQTIEDYYKDDK
ncbi:hypothetical protein EOL96_00835 [Candidatus Saccharibacteria bacterium]|nr:hypothetical protein [Candidatus Saccharibacteria bacterium]